MTRNKQVLRLCYSTKRHEISKEDIDNQKFEILATRRNIMNSRVLKIFDNLQKEKHFDSSFVVSERNGKYRLIDGNHRYEAVAKYLAVNPENRVEVLLHIYDDLSDDEEKGLYTMYNLGRKQSTNDFVQQYKEEISIWNEITNPKRFPVIVTVYGGTGAISFYNVVGAYLSVIQPRFPGGYIGSPLDFIEDAKNLTREDVVVMAAFLKDYMEAFGVVRNNKWFRGTPFNAIMKIWYDNKDHILPSKMVRELASKLGNDMRAIDLCSSSGSGATKYARDKFLLILNETRKNDLFISKDIVKEKDSEEQED